MRAAALVLALAGCGPNVPDAREWAAYTAGMKADGKMRTERAPADAPYTNADLVRNFRETVLHTEFEDSDGVYRPGAHAEPLGKWTRPVRIRVVGDRSTAEDRAYVRDYAARLTRVTGLSVTLTDDDKNEEDSEVAVLFYTPDELAGLATAIERKFGETAMSRRLRDGLAGAVCVGWTSGTSDFTKGLILIPDAVQGVLRQACIEEEIGQAFGPRADDDAARPSIFNDDAEFALLTERDAYLLRILYDPALKPGMTEAEAMALVPGNVARLRPGGVGG